VNPGGHPGVRDVSRSANVNSMVTITRTGLPSSVAGSNRHCLNASTADWSRPYVVSIELITSTLETVPSRSTMPRRRTVPWSRFRIASAV
jgi:hypothetical protein